mmetsp:Transcript_17866/g.38286  ORF Transcript_17866/g.38286 Transcript_17866/m.38286 type:complete len:295 (+) Transcript_17866:991-1875(+)
MVDLGDDGVEEGVELHGVLLEVELDGPVIDLVVGDLLQDHLELIVGVRDSTVRHHGVGSGIELVVVHVEEHSLLPEVMSFAGLDELGDVELGGVHLDEVHELLRLVLCVQDGQLGVHAYMRPLAAQAAVQKLNQFLEVAVFLVLRDEVFEVIGMHDDVHACDLRTSELLGLDAGDVDLAPSLGVVCLLRCLYRLRVLAQLHEAGGQLGVVGDGLVENLGSLEETLVIKPVSNSQDVRGVRSANELLHVAKSVGLRVRVHQLRVHHLVLRRLPGHDQEPDQVLEDFQALSSLNHL